MTNDQDEPSYDVGATTARQFARLRQSTVLYLPLNLRDALLYLFVFTQVCPSIHHTHKPTRLTQPCIPLGSLNRVPALTGWGKGGNVTSAERQVTLCDPIRHVSSRSVAVLVEQTAIHFFTFFLPFYGYSICPPLLGELSGTSQLS